MKEVLGAAMVAITVEEDERHQSGHVGFGHVAKLTEVSCFDGNDFFLTDGYNFKGPKHEFY